MKKRIVGKNRVRKRRTEGAEKRGQRSETGK